MMPTVTCATKTITDSHLTNPEFIFHVNDVYLKLVVTPSKEVDVFQDGVKSASTFSIDVPKASDVVDMSIANFPGSDRYYLAVAVNAEIDWPDRSANENEPAVLNMNE